MAVRQWTDSAIHLADPFHSQVGIGTRGTGASALEVREGGRDFKLADKLFDFLRPFGDEEEIHKFKSEELRGLVFNRWVQLAAVFAPILMHFM